MVAKAAAVKSSEGATEAGARMDPVELTPLSCASCGADVALADAPSVRCDHCGADVPVPELSRRALVAEREAAAGRRRADELGNRLGRLPSWPLRVLGTVFGGWLQFVAGFIFVFAAVGAATIGAVIALGAATHQDLVVILSDRTKEDILTPVWFGSMLLLAGLAVYGRRRAISTRRVQAALAARPAKIDGGPATCRSCGGPLSVPADAVDVRCLYCGTDNLVALPASWVAGLTEANVSVHREIESADAAFSAETRSVRKSTLLHLGFTVVALTAIYIPSSRPSRWRHATPAYRHSDWSVLASDPRALVRRRVLGAMQTWGDAETVTFAPNCADHPTALRLEPRDCDASGCSLWFRAALRHGERARLELQGIPGGARATIEAQGFPRSGGDIPHVPYGGETFTLASDAGRPVEFRAGWSTFYRLEVQLPGATPGTVGACFEVAPP